MPKQRRSYVSNETPNEVSVKHFQDASVVRLYDFIKRHRDNVSRVRMMMIIQAERERDSVRIWQTYMPKNCKWLVKIKKISNICPKWRQNCQNRVERNLFSLHRVLRLTSYLCLTFLSKAGHCLSPWPGLSSSFRLRSWFNFFFVLQSLNSVKQ